ncbi:hypothetical protein BDV25DRAFT_162117 [Aspergillus avenaceus]|uniref:Uncharacterized protein n=1 Tax=Aspergillus avenaceus TaxID=36643 RepID=A0A5N6TK31_ASPAV|nr:hypothetical protein BDV25DRAFT_162117 [Aspergillus avenaceus]
MPQYDEHGSLIAPSPIIPTFRAYSQLSRRAQSNMSMTSAGDNQLGSSAIQTRNDHVPDLVQFFQAQDSLTPISPQSNSARDILRAGQRRLRQLAQRPRKAEDPQSKANEATRQLQALQQEGFLPAPKPKRSAPKRSWESSIGSRSTSNLSFLSSSRRDVESIGQPWIDNSLERSTTQETGTTRLSSFDLRDLSSSFVESAVSRLFRNDGTNPQPSQAAPFNDRQDDHRILHDHVADTAADLSRTSVDEEPFEVIEALPKFPDIPEKASNNHALTTTLPDNKQQTHIEPPDESKSEECKDTPEAATAKSSTLNPSTTPSHPNPVAQSLKLFPDTMPPRMSGKGAWRISNGLPPPNRSSSLTKGLLIANAQASGNSKASPNNLAAPGEPERLVHPDQPASISPSQSRSTLTSPVQEKFLPPKSNRRPASLPMGAIEAFPLPAPTRPLPSLPEPVPGIRLGHGQYASVGRRGPQMNQNASRHSEEVPRGNPTGIGRHVSMPGQTAPDPPEKYIEGQQQGSKVDISRASEAAPTEKVAQNRAERVRALKMKDMTASRTLLKSPESPAIEEKGQLPYSKLLQTGSLEDDDEAVVLRHGSDAVERRYERRVAAEARSPPLSPPPSRPRWIDGRAIRNSNGDPPSCTPTLPSDMHEPSSMPGSKRTSQVQPKDDILSMSVLLERTVNGAGPSNRSNSPLASSLPASKRSSQIQPKDDILSMSVLSERTVNGIGPSDRSNSPLPSSEDESLGADSRQQHSYPISSRRRRHRVTPILVDEPHRRKSHNTKKSSAHDYSRPITPRNRRDHGREKVSSPPPHMQGSYYYHETRGSRHMPSYVLELEKRISHLEHQNKTLQAALLAALDVGGKHSSDNLIGGSTTSLSTPPTGRSFSSATNTSSSPDTRTARNGRNTNRRQPPYRPETWIASPGSSRRSSLESEESADLRELEDMIEDFNFGWESDQPSPKNTKNTRLPKTRA